MKRIAIAVACVLLASSQVQGPNAQAYSSATGAEPSSQASRADWAVYHGNPHGTHYSTLDQINTKNVKRLRVAWTFETGDGAPTNDMAACTEAVDRSDSGYDENPSFGREPRCCEHTAHGR